MNAGKTIQVSDTIHGTIYLSEIEKQVVSTPIFNRLHNIYQNSTVYLTFPSNRTKRFEHSIGTMELCGKIFYYGICNSETNVINDFFSEIKSAADKRIRKILDTGEYRAEIGDENFTESKIGNYNEIEINGSIYTGQMPANIRNDKKFLFVVLLQAIRISALLHDVGHPPFSHITENALKNIWKKIQKIDEDKRTSRQKVFIEALNPYFGSKKAELHEQIGSLISERILGSLIKPIREDKEKDKEALEYQIFKIFIKEFTCAILQEKMELFNDIHKIIDGALDGDRLDYVCRDPHNSGFDIGKIEYGRLLNSIALVKNDTGCYLFCPNVKTLNTVEDFFNRRWKLYKHIINHHRVIKTDYLLQICIENLSFKYLEDSKTEDENRELKVLPSDISGLWKAVKKRPSHKTFFYTLIQWDDSWLMTVLKRHYFEEYIDTKSNIEYQLEELLANKKYYYSVVKKVDDFLDVDKSIAKLLHDKLNSLNGIAKPKECLEPQKEHSESSLVEIDPFLKTLKVLENSVNKYVESNSEINENGFILAMTMKLFSPFFQEGYLSEAISKSIKEMMEKMYPSDIIDSIVVFKDIKTGVQETLALYNKISSETKIIKFSLLSKEEKSLLYDKNFIPVFYVYVLKKNEHDLEVLIKDKIGKCVGETIINILKSRLDTISM